MTQEILPARVRQRPWSRFGSCPKFSGGPQRISRRTKQNGSRRDGSRRLGKWALYLCSFACPDKSYSSKKSKESSWTFFWCGRECVSVVALMCCCFCFPFSMSRESAAKIITPIRRCMERVSEWFTVFLFCPIDFCLSRFHNDVGLLFVVILTVTLHPRIRVRRLFNRR